MSTTLTPTYDTSTLDVTQDLDDYDPRPLSLFMPARDRPAMTSPEQAVKQFLPYFHGIDREVCLVAMLDTKHHLLGIDVNSIGSIDHTFMIPREVLRNALLANASAIILAHNHPSGDSTPSPDDETITHRFSKASEVIGIDILDHLVIGHFGSWTSIRRKSQHLF